MNLPKHQTLTKNSILFAAMCLTGPILSAGGCADDAGSDEGGTDDGTTGGTTSPTTSPTSATTVGPGSTGPGSTGPDSTDGTGTGDTTETGDSSSTGDVELTPFEQAVEAIGGADALNDLTLQYDTSGVRQFSNEGETPGELMALSSYTATYTYDSTSGALRFDMDKQTLFEATQFFPASSFSIVLADGVGGLDAQAGFEPAGEVPSQAVGAFQQQFRFFNPHLYLIDGLDDDSGVSDGGTEMLDGVEHRVIVIQTEVAEVRLLVDAASGLISRLTTLENNQLTRDVPVEINYGDWTPVDGVSFPNSVEISVNGAVVHTQQRSAFQIDPALDPAFFDLPAEAGTPTLDADDLEWGTLTSNGVDEFFHLGFFYGVQPSTAQELAPNVQFLSAGWSSMAVRVGDDVVLLEAPTSGEGGELRLAEAAALFPGSQVTYVVPTHFHQDHAAGVRSVVASGATLVVAEPIRSFWDANLAAPSTVHPDLLANSPGVVPSFVEIAQNDSWTLENADVRLTVHHVPDNPHAEDMVLTEVEANGQTFLFAGDLYNAGGGGTLVLGGPESLFDAMRSLGIIDANCTSATPITIVPTHGVPQNIPDSLAELGMQGVDVGCP